MPHSANISAIRISARCCSTPRARISASARASKSTSPISARRCCAGLHRLVLRMVESPVPILVAVRGQCLGGGLEVALAGHLMFVAPDAALGQPEMKLGVFAPAASCLLPELIGPMRAFDLLVVRPQHHRRRGRGDRARHEAAADPEQAALAYFEEHLEAEERKLAALRRQGGAPRLCRPRESQDHRGRTPLSRRADDDPRCGRGPAGLHRQETGAMGASLNMPTTADIVARATAAVRRSLLQRRARMEGGPAGPQGGRLHADLRAARDHPRRRHAAARHRRRRRPARSHPRRRLLSELHLPHSALDHRARRVRPARFRRRHAVPVDLRRDPQSVGHVEDDVPARLRRATSTCRRITATTSAATTTSTSWPSCDTISASCAASRSPTTSCARSIAVYNENRRLVRELYAFRAERPWQVPAAEALSAAARRARAPGRAALGDAARLSRRRARRGAADGATTAASCSPACSASSRRSI